MRAPGDRFRRWSETLALFALDPRCRGFRHGDTLKADLGSGGQEELLGDELEVGPGDAAGIEGSVGRLGDGGDGEDGEEEEDVEETSHAVIVYRCGMESQGVRRSRYVTFFLFRNRGSSQARVARTSWS